MRSSVNRRAEVALLVAILVLAQSSQGLVEAIRESYKIKANQLDSLADALNLLRKFTPSRLSLAQKCERYAILLQDHRSLTQFSIAELGISPERAGQKVRVDAETLRDLYIKASEELKGGHLDQSLLDLVECLRSKYWAVDSKARSFLNQNEIKTLIEQYKSVAEQPVDILINDEVKHPHLNGDDLHPALKQTLVDLYHGNETKIDLHFPTPEAEEETQTEAPEPEPVTAEPVTPEPVTPEPVTPEPVIPEPITPEPQTIAAPVAAAIAEAQAVDGSATAGAYASSTGSAANSTDAVDENETASSNAEVAEVASIDDASADSDTLAQDDGPGVGSASPVASVVAPVDKEAGPDHEDTVELSDEEKEFLNDLKSNLVTVFDGLPVHAELPDRCLAYSRITGSEETELKQPNRAQAIVEEVTHKIDARPQTTAVGEEQEQAFVPEKEVRDSFLVVLDAYKPEELGEQLWIDVLDCVAAWQEVDPDIKVYLQNHI